MALVLGALLAAGDAAPAAAQSSSDEARSFVVGDNRYGYDIHRERLVGPRTITLVGFTNAWQGVAWGWR